MEFTFNQENTKAVEIHGSRSSQQLRAVNLFEWLEEDRQRFHYLLQFLDLLLLDKKLNWFTDRMKLHLASLHGFFLRSPSDTAS